MTACGPPGPTAQDGSGAEADVTQAGETADAKNAAVKARNKKKKRKQVSSISPSLSESSEWLWRLAPNAGNHVILKQKLGKDIAAAGAAQFNFDQPAKSMAGKQPTSTATGEGFASHSVPSGAQPLACEIEPASLLARAASKGCSMHPASQCNSNP